MSRDGRPLTPEEKKLWRRVAARVKARRAGPVEVEPSSPATRASPAHRPAPAAAPNAAATQKRAHAPVADRGADRRVRRGQVEIDASFDLHGHTQASGEAALKRFLRLAHARGDRTVVVITGVGRGGEGVLRKRVPDWLNAERGIVSGFAQAHRTHGGAGAFYVFLRRNSSPA